MKKKGFEAVLERLSNMTDEEKVAMVKEAKAASKDVEEISDLIISSVHAWMKHHVDDDDCMVPKLMTGMSKGVCFVLASLDSTCGSESGHKPSDTFRAMLPLGMALAKREIELNEKMEHERMMAEGAN